MNFPTDGMWEAHPDRMIATRIATKDVRAERIGNIAQAK